jgi:hypothetical protein
LNLSKADGYQPLADVREGQISIKAFREHLRSLIVSRGIEVNEANIAKPF